MRIAVPAEPTAEQQRVMDEAAAGPRGRIPAPMRAWIANPALARSAAQLGEIVRYRSTLPGNLRELAILTVAREWTSQYEWSVHKGEALTAGVSAAVIDAIAARRAPPFSDEAEALIHDFARTVLSEHAISDELYGSAVERLGATAVVELVCTLGYYVLVSMTLNVFGIDLPPGSARELE